MALDFSPGGRAHGLRRLLEPVGFAGDEVVIEHGPGRRILRGKHAFHQPREHRNVAARPHLVVFLGDLRRRSDGHLDDVLRVDELDQSALAHRVEGHDPAAPFHRRFQDVQEARAVGAGVLPEEEDRVAMVEILQRAGADRRADEGLQVHRGRLVAHVRRLRQVLVAHRPREQCVEIGCLEPSVAGRVEHRLLRIQGAQVPAPISAKASDQ